MVDFKADRLRVEAVAERAKLYTEQLTQDTRAASPILNHTIAAAWLYFLTPPQTIEIKIQCHYGILKTVS